nr:hypothetical protein [Maliibacterium massiliense]
MIIKDVPKVAYASIGGSGTWACEFPNEVGMEGVKVLQEGMQFETPFGTTIEMKLIELDGSITADGKPRTMLYVPFHGFTGLAPFNTPSEQIFWVFQQAGVKYIIVDGSGGSVNPLLDPGDIVVPHDIIDLTKRPSNIHRFCNGIVRMREPMCPELRGLLTKFAREEYGPRVFGRGVYCNTEPPRFETETEIKFEQSMGADITGHTMIPEAYLARAIGAHYAGIYIISNYAEGVQQLNWGSGSIFGHYNDCAAHIGKIVLRTIAAIEPEKLDCRCKEYLMEVPSNVQNRIHSEKVGK